MADVASPGQAASLSELRGRHLDLIERWTPDMDAESTAGLVPLAEALRAEARSLGAWLDDADDRDRAQGIIDYWTAALMGLSGHGFPELMRLEPFDPALAEAAAGRAEAIVAPNDGTSREEDAETMLLALVRTGPNDRIVCRAPAERGDLVRAGASETIQAGQAEMLDRLVGAGIINRLSDGRSEEDCYEFAYGSIARAWPRLRRWLEQRRNSFATREKLKATAQLWKDSGDTGYLLSGDALSEGGKYSGEDPLLTEFIRVSRRAADRRRWQWIAAGTVGPVLAALIMTGVYDVSFDWGVEDQDRKQIERSEAPNLEAALANETAAAPAPAVQTAPTQARSNLGTPGWIWAGTVEAPLLRDPETGQLADLAAIEPGSTWRLRTEIVLREGGPGPNNASAPQVALVPAGALVLVIGNVRRVERPSGLQYWLPVRVLPRVYIQYANARPAQVEPLRGVLREMGVEAPPIDQERSAARRHEVRYFRKEDSRLAAELTQRLRATLRGPGRAPVDVRCVRSGAGRPDSSHLEIWLDFRGLELGAPRVAPAAPPAPTSPAAPAASPAPIMCT